jgi:Xaa-Pro aminopeptidase
MSINSYLGYVKLATKRRVERLEKIMEAENLSALLLFESDPIAYKIALTNHFNSVLVLPNSIYVFTDPTLYLEALSESPWNVVLVENFTLGELAKKILGLLREYCKRQKLVIGINKMWGRIRLSFFYADLLEALHSQGIEIIDATNILTMVFDKPFEEELPIIKWISNAASQALQAIEEALRPGMREYEVAAIADKVLDENGIIDRWFSTIVASGPRAASPHAKTSTRKISPGDPIIVDLGPIWMGYDGCIAYTFIAGQNKYWKDIFEKVKHALWLGLEHARPKVPVRILDEIPRSVLKREGLPNYPHLTGHPIGGFYKPVIADFIDYKLETNMVFAYEPATYIPGKGGVRIEPHILITKDDYEILTEFHKAHIA